VGPRQALACCALVASTAALAESFEVTGSCRDGLPHGNYELRTADGRLRVAGAFAQGRKTGTFIFWTRGGGRIAVVPYDEDARSGTVALWYVTSEGRVESGRRLEAPYVGDRLHGVARSWYPNGAPRAEYSYEHGQLSQARAWTEAGAVLSDAEASARAVRDAEADQRLLDEIVAMVYEHLPRCD
jgi:antitoxin component YwqK of YwqJK toxin-antitoxin module